jgi:excisionase family DNA binding protein
MGGELYGGQDPIALEERPLPPGQDLLRPSQVAAALNVHHRTVLAWLKAGKLRGGQTPGGQWRVPAVEVRRLRAQFGITDDGSG